MYPALPVEFLQRDVPAELSVEVQAAVTREAERVSMSKVLPTQRHLLGYFLAFGRGVIPKALKLLPGGKLIPSSAEYLIINQVRGRTRLCRSIRM